MGWDEGGGGAVRARGVVKWGERRGGWRGGVGRGCRGGWGEGDGGRG